MSDLLPSQDHPLIQILGKRARSTFLLNYNDDLCKITRIFFFEIYFFIKDEKIYGPPEINKKLKKMFQAKNSTLSEINTNSQLEKELKALPIEKLADLQPGEYVTKQ